MLKSKNSDSTLNSFLTKKIKPKIVIKNTENIKEIVTKTPEIDVEFSEYSKFLAIKSILKWKDFAGKKRRNEIRAKVHYKFVLYQRIWDQWMRKLDIQYVISKKYEMAVGYGKIHLC